MKKQLILALTCILFLNCEKDFSPYVYFTEGFHIRKSVIYFVPYGPREYNFRNVPRLCGFVTSFPWNAVLDSLLTNSTYEIEVEYWIFTSVDDAELYMVERLDMTSLQYYNIIDYPLSEGAIGDNCYHQITGGRISFIRNNVWVHVGPPCLFDPFECTEIEQVARHIDSAIVADNKVPSGKQVPAPRISSVEVIGQLPEDWNQTVKIRVKATDVKYDTLSHRMVGYGLALVYNDGLFTIKPNQNVPVYWSDDPNKFRFMAWVWNESHLVELAEKELPFSR